MKKTWKFLACICVTLQSLIMSTLAASDYLEDEMGQFAKEASINFPMTEEDENKIFEHFQEALLNKTNPIQLAFEKKDLALAELLLKMRESDLKNGKAAFDFPGYEFKRSWKCGTLDVWMKPAPVTFLNKWGGERHFYLNKIDLEAVKLLMKYDQKGLWYMVIGDILRHAYQMCDLEAVLFCQPYIRQSPPTELFIHPDFLAAQNKIGQATLLPRYLVDPFLVNFPVDIDNPKHFYSGSANSRFKMELPSIWDYRPDDTKEIIKLKKEIQDIVWGMLIFE